MKRPALQNEWVRSFTNGFSGLLRNRPLVVTLVDDKPVDDGYRSMYMMLIHESHVFELQIQT